ncbi:hypothetical protein, partial [Klebsiella pneumoniae]|uniref:hypothetical protein n=1 Tax=Klebsiella pneumoniae TaxID=573 RepID=UPI00351DBA18
MNEHNPHDSRFTDATRTLKTHYRRSLQDYMTRHKQTRHWIDDSSLSADDRARAHFAFSLINDAVSPSNTLLNPLAIKELLNS